MLTHEMEKIICDAANNSFSMTAAAKKVGIHYLTFRKYAKRLDVWKPNQSGRGLSSKNKYTQTPLQEILEGKHPSYSSYSLKRRLLKAGIKNNICEICEISSWQDKPLICHMDHVSGNSTDHRLKNLRMLCPNCHSQTSTWCAKNKYKGTHSSSI